MLDTVVKVKGEITYAVGNPMDRAGYHEAERCQRRDRCARPEELWQTWDEAKKEEFTEGKTLTAEGIFSGRERCWW
jgi:hypothetical protein